MLTQKSLMFVYERGLVFHVILNCVHLLYVRCFLYFLSCGNPIFCLLFVRELFHFCLLFVRELFPFRITLTLWDRLN